MMTIQECCVIIMYAYWLAVCFLILGIRCLLSKMFLNFGIQVWIRGSYGDHMILFLEPKTTFINSGSCLSLVKSLVSFSHNTPLYQIRRGHKNFQDLMLRGWYIGVGILPIQKFSIETPCINCRWGPIKIKIISQLPSIFCCSVCQNRYKYGFYWHSDIVEPYIPHTLVLQWQMDGEWSRRMIEKNI